MIGNPLLLGGGDYEISRSVRLRSSASAYFNRTPASAGNRKTWTWSGWVKRGAINSSGYYSLFSAGTTSPTYDGFRFGLDSLQFFQAGGNTSNLVTTSVYRDASAWYHVVLAVDTTQATSSNRVKIYVNGVQTTSFSTANYPSLNTEASINNTLVHNVGAQQETSASFHFDGYLTEINFIDGQALTPSSFGESNSTTGVWQPKKYTGTYGTNGFYLNFSDNSNNTAATIGKDYSGNGNNWTPNNISVTSGATYDSMLDVPTPWADGGNGRGNYAVLNPLNVFASNPPVISNGNLQVLTTTGNYGTALGSIGISSGKHYWEITPTAGTGGFAVGFANSSADLSQYVGQNTNSWCYYNDGTKYTNNSSSAYGASFTTNDVIGVALDMDAGTVTFYKNGTIQGQAFSGLTGTLFPAVSDGSNSASSTFVANFGQRPFAYTPPSGFLALNTLNLPEPTIVRGNRFFDATTYTGTGAAQNIVNSGAMQPDLVWIKSRSVAGSNHELYDAVRGATIFLSSNTTGAEGTLSQALTAFNSNGFALGNGTSSNSNSSGASLVAWQWREGATQGFDIVTFAFPASGPWTLAHNLGVAPRMVIVKSRSNGLQPWVVYHAALGNTGYVLLNATDAFAANITVWNNTTPTSSVVTMGSGFTSANYGANGVAYLFSEVAGFSRFGSYTGNGSTDGPFVFCGFRPRFVLVKRTDTTAFNWVIIDTARDTYNAGGLYLYPNLSAAEDDYRASTGPIDILSNGFKPRSALGNVNASGGTYIFAAFAEHPFKLSLAR